MVDNLICFPYGQTDPEVIIKKAQGQGLKSVIIIGYDQDDELWVSSSDDRIADLNLLLDRAKQALLDI